MSLIIEIIQQSKPPQMQWLKGEGVQGMCKNINSIHLEISKTGKYYFEGLNFIPSSHNVDVSVIPLNMPSSK